MTKSLLRRLDHLQYLAQGARWQRFLHKPVAYLSVLLHRKLVYPFTKKEWIVAAKTFFGARMTVVLPAAAELVLLGLKAHDSELRLTRFMLQRLSYGATAADIGGHFGFYSLLAAHLVGKTGSVITFEASPNVFKILQENTAAFPQIDAVHGAVSNARGTLPFYDFPTYYSEYNTLSPEQFEQSDWFDKIPHQKVEVPAIRLDDFFAEKFPQPDFIKIDVEGSELQVIQGAQRLLQEHHPIIAMEFLAAERVNAGHRQALELLQTLGYRAHYIDLNGNLQPCTNVDAYLTGKGLDSDNIVFVK